MTPLLLALSLVTAAPPTVAELEAIAAAPAEARTRTERRRACESLLAHGDASAAQSLIRLLQHPEAGRYALDALDELTAPETAPHLVELRRASKDARVRGAALRALRVADRKLALEELLDEVDRGQDTQIRRQALGWAAEAADDDDARARVARRLLKHATGPLATAARLSADDVRPMPRALLEPAFASADEARRAVACEGAGRDDLDLVAKAVAASSTRQTLRACTARLYEEADAAPELVAEALLAYSNRTKDFYALDKATERLPHTVAPLVVKALLPRLEDERPPSRLASIFEWAGDPSAADALARRYERSEATVWLGAYAASIQTRSQLNRLLSWRDRARHSIANAISGVRHPELATALVPLLRDDDVNVRAATARALGRLAVEDTAVALLDAATGDSARRVRDAAATSLAYVASEDALGRMSKILKKGDHLHLVPSFVRTSRVFGHKHTKRLLRRKDNGLAHAILNAILRDVHPSDEGLLLHQLGERDFSRQQLAVIALGSLHTDRARAALCKTLKKNRRLRSTAARSLAQFRDLEAVDCLIGQLARSTPRKEPSTHESIQRALRYTTGENLEDLKAWRAWRKSGAPAKRSTAEWLLVLDDESGDVRALAARQIADRFDASRDKAAFRALAAPAVAAALAHEQHDDALRAEARALERIRDPNAAAALVAALQHAPRRDAQRAIIQALDAIGDGRGTLRLVRALDSHDPAARQRAAEDLAMITGEPLHYDVARWRAWWKKHAERYRR